MLRNINLLVYGFLYSKCRYCEFTFEEMQMNFNKNQTHQTKGTVEKQITQCIEMERATDDLESALHTTCRINREK